MIKILKGAPKVKVFERDVRKDEMSDYERLRAEYLARLAAQEWDNNHGNGGQGGSDGGGDNPYIPDQPEPPGPDSGDRCEFNYDFNNDFNICGS